MSRNRVGGREAMVNGFSTAGPSPACGRLRVNRRAWEEKDIRSNRVTEAEGRRQKAEGRREKAELKAKVLGVERWAKGKA